MDIAQLKYFVTLASTENFSEAARICGISQPSMSHSISSLEKQLGTELFYRSRKSVTLSDTGAILLPAASEVLDIIEKAVSHIHQVESNGMGSVDISALTTCSDTLMSLQKSFASRYPDIVTNITFTSGSSEVISSRSSKYDIFFCAREMITDEDIFDYIVISQDYLCVAFPAEHPLADEELDFSKFKNENFIGIAQSDGPLFRQIVYDLCIDHGYEPKITCQYDRAEAVLLAVAAGTGIGIVPEALGKVFYTPKVKLKRIPGKDAVRTYVAAWKRDMLNPAARLFIRVAKEYLSPDKK